MKEMSPFYLLQKRCPFDTNTPIGYLNAVILEYIILGYELFMIACNFALGIGAFWFANAIIKEIQRILHSINSKAKAQKKQSNELVVLFSDYIYTHGIEKQFSVISTI